MIALLVALAAPAAAEAPAPAPAPAAEARKETAISASLVVAVTQRDAASDAIVAKARALGGWFQARDDQSVSLRVPVDRAEELVAFATAQGKVIDRSFARQDLSSELTELRGRLEARRSVLDQYDQVLGTATLYSIVSVESAILQVIGEMEAFQGRIQLLEDQGRYARLDVRFQFLDRSAPARDGSSSFRWLNTLNVQDVMAGMWLEEPTWRTRGADAPTPEGFSAWKKKRGVRAASPDGALYRVRVEPHKPRADLAFWKEAVRERSEAAGYRVSAETDLAGATPGAAIELVAPISTEDWTYLVAFFPVDGKIVIAEAAAEVTVFEAHRDAILAAVRAIGP